MQLIQKILLILIASFLTTLVLPWYLIAIVAFITGLVLGNKPGNNFVAGFLGVSGFWLIYILYYQVVGDTLAPKIAAIFSENMGQNISPFLLILITLILGGLIGGLACLSGGLLVTKEGYSSTNYSSSSRKKSYKLKLK